MSSAKLEKQLARERKKQLEDMRAQEEMYGRSIRERDENIGRRLMEIELKNTIGNIEHRLKKLEDVMAKIVISLYRCKGKEDFIERT